MSGFFNISKWLIKVGPWVIWQSFLTAPRVGVLKRVSGNINMGEL